MSGVNLIVRHVAGGIYIGPDYTPMSDADQRWLLTVLTDEVVGARDIDADTTHIALVARQMIQARVEQAKFERDYQRAQHQALEGR